MRQAELEHHCRVAEQLLESLNCPRSLTVAILLRNRMWDDIASLEIDPDDYIEPEAFDRAYQATRLLSKAEWLPTSWDTMEVAKSKFKLAEEQCLSTNEFFRQIRRKELKLLPDYERIFWSARRKIGLVLGTQLYRWTEFCGFGPGADSSTNAGMTSAYNKLSSPGEVTFGALPLISTYLGLTSLCELFTWDIETRCVREIAVTRGNRVTFVPKNAKTDRAIAVEPRWNVFLQKGLGQYLRYRLKLFGVDLNDQSVNQTRAKLGAARGTYATIDLAAASDTISKELVKELLPEPWLAIFEALRSPCYLLDNSWAEYQKWSSMGNGYTFELESLLFWALASSVDEDVTVYGDDLVVPTHAFDKIVNVLACAGFKTNVTKSFGKGYFRESCGSDAFASRTVTPIYWKSSLDELGTLRLVNQISVLAERLGPTDGLESFRDKVFRPIWKDLIYHLPKRFQVRGPSSLSTVIHDSYEKWKCSRRYGWDGWHLVISVAEPRKFPYADLMPAMKSQWFQPSSGGYAIRNAYTWKKRTVFIPRGFKDLGRWA